MILIALLYIAAVLMVPFYIGPELAENAQINAERLLLMLLGVSIFLGNNARVVGAGIRVLVRERGLLTLIIGVFFTLRLVSAFASPYAVSVLIVLNELASNLLVFVVFFSVFLQFDIRRELETVFVVAVGFIFAVTLFELAAGYNPFTQFAPLDAGGAINAAEMSRDGFLRVKGTFEHALTLGHAIVMLLPFFLFASRLGTGLRYTMIARLLLMAVFTGSRTTILISFAEVGAALIINAGRLQFGEKAVSTRAVAIAFAVLAVFTAVFLAQTTTGKGLFESYIREAQINNGLIAIQHKLWLGYGPGPGALDALVTGMKGVGALRMWQANLTTVDNWYLTVLLTSGLPSLIFFMAMIVLLIAQGMRLLVTDSNLRNRLVRYEHQGIALAVFVSTLSAAIYMVTLSIFTVHALFYMFAAWLTATYVHTRTQMA
jgi:hypothetical protein